MKNTAWVSLPCLLLLSLSFIWMSFRSEPPVKKQSFFDLIYSEKPLKLEIESDLQLLVDNKNTNDYFPSTLRFVDKQEKTQKWEVEVRSRGRFRRRVCQFPPLKIKFSKQSLKDEGFKKHNEFKLVTHCVADLAADEYLLREFLIYKLYNIITDSSYRVQLIRATYKDTQSSSRIKRYAILMEDEDDLEDRVDGKVCDECYNPQVEQLNLEEIHKLCLFQFMIGNSDWSVRLLRNLKLLESKDSTGIIGAPYDFDFAGLVNAPYAIPNVDFGLENCRQRIFMGFAEEEQELQGTIELFQSKKQEMFDYIDNFKFLPKSSRKDITKYIESFYTTLEQDSFLNQIIEPD